MKKIISMLVVFIEMVLYIIFSMFYASKGFALKWAKETSEAHVVYNEYGKSYSYLYFNPISEVLYKVSFIGVILVGIILIVHATYITYKKSDYFKINENIHISFWYRVKRYVVIILIALVYAFILYFILRVFKVHLGSEIGTEGVYFELF